MTIGHSLWRGLLSLGLGGLTISSAVACGGAHDGANDGAATAGHTSGAGGSGPAAGAGGAGGAGGGAGGSAGGSSAGSGGGSALGHPVRILTVGDSITEFTKQPIDTCPEGYRYELFKELIDAGLDFDMVGTHNMTKEYPGPQNTLPPYKNVPFDNDTDGWGGWASGDILNGNTHPNAWCGALGCAAAGKISGWVNAVDYDAVLLHIGTNDAADWGYPPPPTSVEQYVKNVSGIIDVIQAKRPAAIIYLAKIIPLPTTGQSPAAVQRVLDYDAQIDGIAMAKSTGGKRVVVVDQLTGYDAMTDNACDKLNVHPGVSGAQKIAKKWAAALLRDFGPKHQ